MSTRLLPAVVATILAVMLAILLFVPFVAHEYRKRGELGAGTAILRFACLLYALGLLAYVAIPLPPIAPGLCEAFNHLRPQWEPFASFAGLSRPRGWAELLPLLSKDAVQQFGFNVLLFVPLGILARHMLRRGMAAVAFLGLATSLAIELTQLTGIWFLYPCPFRLFDVDDLIANTSGALLGCVLAPSLRLVPGQRPSRTAQESARPVTAHRRLLGMCCDTLLLWWCGSIAAQLSDIGQDRWRLGTSPAQQAWLDSAVLCFLPALLLLISTAFGGGTSLGQHAVLLRMTDRHGSRSGFAAVGFRWLVGLGGLALMQGVLSATGFSAMGGPLAIAWCTVHGFGVTRCRDRRGISARLAGLYVVDARRVRPAYPIAHTPAVHAERFGEENRFSDKLPNNQ